MPEASLEEHTLAKVEFIKAKSGLKIAQKGKIFPTKDASLEHP